MDIVLSDFQVQVSPSVDGMKIIRFVTRQGISLTVPLPEEGCRLLVRELTGLVLVPHGGRNGS